MSVYERQSFYINEKDTALAVFAKLKAAVEAAKSRPPHEFTVTYLPVKGENRSVTVALTDIVKGKDASR